MFGIDDAILGSVGGSLVSGLFNSSAASSNRDFQRDMSNSSYQRAVKDLKAAGLNPMLAYGNGGASTPNGAVSAPLQAGDLGVSSAGELSLRKQQGELMKAQIEKTLAERDLTDKQSESIDNQNMLFSLFGVDKGRQELFNLMGQGDKQVAEIDSLRQGVQKMIQDIETGKASAGQHYATIEQLKAATRNLNLDSREKEAMAKMWDTLGSGGAAAKTFVPFLQLIKSIIGGK